jgi:hypothetical protein
MVSVMVTPAAVPLEDPKLDRMSVRTMPLSSSTLTTLPLLLFDPSAG